MHKISGGKPKEPEKIKKGTIVEAPKGRFKPIKCIALVTRSVYLCGKDYQFIEKQEYNIDIWEVFEKLTNPDNPVLKEIK
jgi:hypothetical protein